MQSIWFALRRSRLEDEKRVAVDSYLLKALQDEKNKGQQIAIYSRIAALIVIAVLLIIVNTTVSVFYYQAFLLAFMVTGWLQLKYARVGQSRIELLLIFVDFALLTFICVAPNPFVEHEVPAAFAYRFDNFIYFFVLLSGASLAYSWRTIWSIGTMVPLLWAVAFAWAYFFGNTMPDLKCAIGADLRELSAPAGTA